jgi:hypothetical protein
LLHDSPQTLYWVGFLLADGYINHKVWRLSLSLAAKDRAQLEAFSAYTSAPSVRRYTTTTNGVAKHYVRLSVQDKQILPKFAAKYDFNPRKTFNPPSYEKFLPLSDDLFIALLVGYLDGDGRICRVGGKRRDAQAFVQCHRSWLSLLRYMRDRIYRLAGADPEPGGPYINRRGYAYMALTTTQVLRFLKNATLRLKLPVLARKWEQIDENFTSRVELSQLRLPKLQQLLHEGRTCPQMAESLGVSYGAVYQQLGRLGIRLRRDRSLTS